jgi:hypothetical protein
VQKRPTSYVRTADSEDPVRNIYGHMLNDEEEKSCDFMHDASREMHMGPGTRHACESRAGPVRAQFRTYVAM